MSDRARPSPVAGARDTTAPVRWLLAEAVEGVGLTKTHALRRAVVRAAADRWPEWWDHELFGPPHREAELPVLEAAREGLLRLRLVRRRRETLRTSPRGRRLLADQDALLLALHADMGAADRFDADAWPAVEAALHDHGPLAIDDLARIVGPLIHVQGWRGERGEPFDQHSLSRELIALLCRAEAYGLIVSDRNAARMTLGLTASGRQLACRPSDPQTSHARPGPRSGSHR